uniref:Alba domain-containing protein n=1 Tax=Macrostomum lignano TaxID=282301 RepID=A0A1I8FIP6_9PLAT
CKGFERLRNLCSAPAIATVKRSGLCTVPVWPPPANAALTMCTNLGKDDFETARFLRVFQLLSGVRLCTCASGIRSSAKKPSEIAGGLAPMRCKRKKSQPGSGRRGHFTRQYANVPTDCGHMAHSSPALLPSAGRCASRLPSDTLATCCNWFKPIGKPPKADRIIVQTSGISCLAAPKEKALQILWEMAHESGLAQTIEAVGHCATYPGEEMQLRVDCDRPKRAAFQLASRPSRNSRRHRTPTRRCARMAASVPARPAPQTRPSQTSRLTPTPDWPMSSLRLATPVPPLERALPAICWPTIRRTYPAVEALPTTGRLRSRCSAGPAAHLPRSGCLQTICPRDSPLLTYSLQCLFSMPTRDQAGPIGSGAADPAQLYLVGHLVSKSVSALAILSSSAFQTDWLPHLLACAASL